ncbi:chemotaxis protein CheW [uncultured Maritimibacter sp.]|jgi:purine-binding chemotaxis protein CheW|uniref:chemotaxis protein CheW n=1 Tax=uncultured Maritimibacter sp. TaxID=991866 RepID=UPI00261293B8|nr:chemotaxis protein CheW [uncultured Maritimibacter sp.]
MNGVGTVVTFGVGDETFAIPVSKVQEVLEMRQISRLPDSPGHVLGVIDVRGHGVSVIDLRKVMKLPDQDDGDATRIIVLWLDEDDLVARVAMRADRVYEVTLLDDDRIEPVPEAELLRWDCRLVTGLGRRHEAFVALIDLDHLFAALPSRLAA